MKEDRKELGKINVQKRALKIDELEDKVRFAIEAYKRAFDKYKRGVDSTNDWNMVIRALTLQLDEIREYIAMAHHNIGVIYASNNNFTLAIESFRSAISFNPDYAVAHNNLAAVYRKVGDMANSLKQLDEAKRLGYNPKK